MTYCEYKHTVPAENSHFFVNCTGKKICEIINLSFISKNYLISGRQLGYYFSMNCSFLRNCRNLVSLNVQKNYSACLWWNRSALIWITWEVSSWNIQYKCQWWWVVLSQLVLCIASEQACFDHIADCQYSNTDHSNMINLMFQVHFSC